MHFSSGCGSMPLPLHGVSQKRAFRCKDISGSRKKWRKTPLMYIPGGTLHIPFRQHVRRKNKNMPLALLDQSVHRCVHLWRRLHCGPDDQQILRPEKTLVLQGGIVVHGRHRTIHARSDRRQSLRPGRPPHRRASGRACQLSGRRHSPSGHPVRRGVLV